jgi:hypothetical protein
VASACHIVRCGLRAPRISVSAPLLPRRTLVRVRARYDEDLIGPVQTKQPCQILEITFVVGARMQHAQLRRLSSWLPKNNDLQSMAGPITHAHAHGADQPQNVFQMAGGLTSSRDVPHYEVT